MAYSTQIDLEALVGQSTLVSLTNETVGATIVDSTVVAAMIAKADIVIDAKAGQVYVVPFSPVPSIIKTVSANLAICYCMARRFATMEMPKQCADIKKETDQLLDDISNELDYVPDSTKISSVESDFIAPTSALPIDFNDQSDQASLF